MREGDAFPRFARPRPCAKGGSAACSGNFFAKKCIFPLVKQAEFLYNIIVARLAGMLI